MKRFVSTFITGAAVVVLVLGIAASAFAQAGSAGAGSLILSDILGHKVILSTPINPSPEYTAWSDAGFPTLTWGAPVPPASGVQAGFVYSGPTTGSIVPHFAYWLPPGQTSLNGSGRLGGYAGAWDYATAAQLGVVVLPSAISGNVIPKSNGSGSFVASSLSDDGTLVKTAENVQFARTVVMQDHLGAPTTGCADQLSIQGLSDTNQQLMLGYNTVGSYGTIQAIIQGSSVRPLYLQPAGSKVGVKYLGGSTLPYDLSVNGTMGSTNGASTAAAGTFSNTFNSGASDLALTASTTNAAGAAINVTNGNVRIAGLTVSRPVVSDAGRNLVTGTIDLSSANFISNTLGVTNGGTGSNLSATGGASKVLMQTSLGGNVTVAQLASSNLSDAANLITSSTSAGGDLGGTYPSPTVISVANVTTGTLGVAHGGTGVANPTQYGVLVGEGTSPVSPITSATTGTVLTGTATNPAFSATPTLGVVSSLTGSLALANSASANLTTIQAGNATAAVTYKLPTANGSANQVLTTDGNSPAQLSWSTPATTTQMFFGGSQDDIKNAAQYYFPVGVGNHANAAVMPGAMVMSTTGSLSSFYVSLNGAMGGAGDNVTFVVYKNGVATGLSVTISGAVQVDGSASASVSYVLGDQFSIGETGTGIPGGTKAAWVLQ